MYKKMANKQEQPKTESKALQVTVESAANQLIGVTPETKELMQTLESVKTFADGVQAINKYAQIGKNTWVMTALVVNKTFSTATAKEASKLVAQFQKDLDYSRAQVYNYRKAGVKLLEGLTEGKIKSLVDIPANMADFIRPSKKAKNGFVLVVDSRIGSISLTTGERIVYRVHDENNKDKVQIIATSELQADKIEVTYAEVDGKETQVCTCGETEHEVDGKIVKSPCQIEYKVLPL